MERDRPLHISYPVTGVLFDSQVGRRMATARLRHVVQAHDMAKRSERTLSDEHIESVYSSFKHKFSM